jgi:hypothetical protein
LVEHAALTTAAIRRLLLVRFATAVLGQLAVWLLVRSVLGPDPSAHGAATFPAQLAYLK